MEEMQTRTSEYGKNAGNTLENGEFAVCGLNDRGRRNIVMSCCNVLPGIELIYNDVNMQRYRIEPMKPGGILRIEYCREGGLEFECGREYLYLSAGDFFVVYDNPRNISCFPAGRYRGISVSIDFEKATKCLSCILSGVNLSPAEFAKKFSSADKIYAARSDERIERIFSDLYSVPESIKNGYLKVKILELLLLMAALDSRDGKVEAGRVSRSHAILANNVRKHLIENIERHLTIEQLSKHFHISATQLKEAFKMVYGISVYSYIRTQKMRFAAHMLIETDKSVLEIAGFFGYDNGSKFAGAFKDVMGVAPNEYRRLSVKGVCQNCPNGAYNRRFGAEKNI